MTHARLTKKIPPGFSLDVDLPLAGVTALYGPPGAGKTLLLEALAGFAIPDAGRILLDDVILFDAESRVNVPPRRRLAGYIGSDDSLFPHMTLEQNLKFAARRFPRLDRHRRVAETLERFQLTALAKTRPPELTAARKLRGAVARALVAEPKLLLLDDRGFDEAMLGEIRAACSAPIVLVTADLDFACAAAGTLVVMDAGRILQRGTPREVLDHPESIEVARLLGIPNLLPGTIAALDPGRKTSRIDFEHFSLNGPYLPGHFRGDQIWVAVDAEALRVHSGEAAVPLNAVPAQLVRVSDHSHTVRLEFAGPLVVEIAREEYGRQRDNKSWLVEFPEQALKIL
jgi:molybdate transport system ATP-binding protein